MSDDATVTASLHIVKLVDRARDLDPEAVEELAARVEVAVAAPDRSVAVAFGLRRRGGEQPQRTAARRGRDRAIKALAPGGDLPLEQQARSSRRSLPDIAPILEMRSHKANVAGCGRLGKVACLIPESGKFDEFSETTIFDIQSGVWMSRALSHYLNQGNSGGS
jgi:hypothetical protein